jgi:AICAR transformylase/IMP cyclohydrolase PurH
MFNSYKKKELKYAKEYDEKALQYEKKQTALSYALTLLGSSGSTSNAAKLIESAKIIEEYLNS